MLSVGRLTKCVLNATLCYHPFHFSLLFCPFVVPTSCYISKLCLHGSCCPGKVKNIGHGMEYKIFKVIKINASILIIIVATNVNVINQSAK